MGRGYGTEEVVRSRYSLPIFFSVLFERDGRPSELDVLIVSLEREAIGLVASVDKDTMVLWYNRKKADRTESILTV